MSFAIRVITIGLQFIKLPNDNSDGDDGDDDDTEANVNTAVHHH